jgi:DNA-binding transcriptional ArsR family regulator
VVDLTAALGLAQGTVSGHLACLRDQRALVVGRPQGRQMFYSLAHPELLGLLRAAELLLHRTGDAVQLCPTDSAENQPRGEGCGGCGADQ